MELLVKPIKDLVGLLYPPVCPGCGLRLLAHEPVVCTICQFKIPQTDQINVADNPVAQLFWGRVQFVRAFAACYYQKGTRLQKMLYRLKYKNQPGIGNWLGQLAGSQILHADWTLPDLIVPVPMHRARRKLRAYNQAEQIAAGIKEMTEIPIGAPLAKVKDTGTQTGRSRMKRWEHIAGSYKLVDDSLVTGKHVLLVDDVVTTGATAEACTLELQNAPGTIVSFCAIGAAID
jgi:ComF family protein